MGGAGSPPEGQPHSSGPAPHSCPFPWPQHPPTCWKESSKSVCRDTLIFTWLGRALDCKQDKSTKAQGCVRLARLSSPTPAHRARGTHTAAHSCCTHVAEEAELVVLPAKAPVIRARGAAVFAPAKAAGPRHTPCPEQPPAPAGCSSPLTEPTRAPSPPVWGLPRLEARARVLEGGGAGVVVHEVPHALVGVFHLPARRQWWLLDHPAGTGGLTRQAPRQSPPQLQLCARPKEGFVAWDW